MPTVEIGVDARPMRQGVQEATQALDGVAKAAERTTAAVEETAQAATGVGRAAAAASSDVRKISQAATDASKSVANAGASMRAAFQATGGSIQVAGGIAQTAKAFGELNVAAAAFGSSRALLEIGKTVEDFRELAATVGKTGSVFQTLGAIVKANPLLTIATVLGSIGSLMSIFSDNTKKAAEAFEDLGTAMSKARMDAATAAYLGATGPGTQGQQQALFEAVGRARTTGAGINLREFGTGPGQIGYGAQAARYLAQQGTPQQQAAAQEYLRTGGYQAPVYTEGGQFVGRQQRGFEFIQGLPDIQLSPQQTQEVLRSIYQQIVETSQQVAANTSQIYQFGAGGEVQRELPGVMGLPAGGRPVATAGYQTNLATGQLLPQYQVTPGEAPYYVGRPAVVTPAQPAPLPPAVAPGQAPYYLGGAQATGVYEFGAAGPEGGALQESALQVQRDQAEADRKSVEASREVAENMQRAADFAGSIGAQLGSSFADVLLKTTTLRQAFASIVASFARQGLADVGAQIFRGAVGGLTPRQTGQNVGVSP